jgi:hypothetical protein
LLVVPAAAGSMVVPVVPVESLTILANLSVLEQIIQLQ